jgi:hypothetical protein
MACSGAYCNEHGTGTTTCSQHRASCSTNRALSASVEFGITTGRIRADDINNLRTSIRDEIARYNLHRSFAVGVTQPTAYTTSTLIDNTHINEMHQMVQSADNVREPVGTSYATLTDPADATTDANSYANDATMNAGDWTSLRDKYNVLRQDCICNSDCACNLVCSCHNNCGCNYSDESLKENITYLGTRRGINIYKYNYIGDTSTQYVGVIAQEVLDLGFTEAVELGEDGFFKVHYDRLPNRGELWSDSDIKGME